jgi:hypothetical protein
MEWKLGPGRCSPACSSHVKERSQGTHLPVSYLELHKHRRIIASHRMQRLELPAASRVLSTGLQHGHRAVQRCNQHLRTSTSHRAGHRSHNNTLNPIEEPKAYHASPYAHMHPTIGQPSGYC